MLHAAGEVGWVPVLGWISAGGLVILGSWWVVITIQRVRVRWTAATRGSPGAVFRRGLDAAVRLPAAMPDGEVVVQDVLAAEAAGYERSFQVFGGVPAPARARASVHPRPGTGWALPGELPVHRVCV